MSEIGEGWAEADREKDERTRIAIVGRPNAGKSSLVNAWVGTDRTMVASFAGTTRDAVDVPAMIDGEEVLFIDTAGLRQKRRVEDPLEKIMGGRTAHAIDRCHLAILAVDSVLGVGLVEKKVAGLIQRAQRPCIIAITKWDLTSEGGEKTQGATFRKEYEAALRQALFFLPDVPMVFVSSLKKSGLKELSDAVTLMRKARSIKIGTGELIRVLLRATESRSTPVKGGKKLRLYYATQVEGPLPTLMGFVNHPAVMSEAYERFLSNRVREHFQLGGCPLRWRWRGRDKKSGS
jgi:GTP-binding protein